MKTTISQEATWYLHTEYVPIEGTQQAGENLQRLVLLNLCARANKEGLAWPSRATIASSLGCAPRDVQNALEALERQGLVERTTNKERKKGALVKWLVLPEFTRPLLEASEVDGITRQVEVRVDGEVDGRVDGRVDGITRHELELEREHKPLRKKSENNATPARGREEWKLEKILKPAVQRHFDTYPTKHRTKPVERMKEGQAEESLEKLLAALTARTGVTVSCESMLDTEWCAQLVAIDLSRQYGKNEPPIREGDIEKMLFSF